jgi:hypothetical protein
MSVAVGGEIDVNLAGCRAVEARVDRPVVVRPVLADRRAAAGGCRLERGFFNPIGGSVRRDGWRASTLHSCDNQILVTAIVGSAGSRRKGGCYVRRVGVKRR